MEKQINVLHCVYNLGIGGVQKNLLSLVKLFNKDKFRIFIAYSNGDVLRENFEKEGVVLIKIQDNGLSFKDFKSYLSVIKLIRIIKEFNIDIVHAHLFVPFFYAYIASKLLKIPIINHIHAEAFNYNNTTEGDRQHPLLSRILLNGTSMTIAITNSTEQKLLKLGLAKDRVSLIANGIDIPGPLYMTSLNSELIKKEYRITHSNIICSIGRLVPQKNHRLLLHAISKVILKIPDTQLIIVGDGPLRNELEDLCDTLKINHNITFTGNLFDVNPILHISDVFVLTSLWEVHPISVLEAMALRKPVIGPKLKGLEETIIDGETGILFSAWEIDSLVSSLISMIKNKRRAVEMGENGYNRVMNRYSNEINVNKIENIYKRLVEKKWKTT